MKTYGSNAETDKLEFYLLFLELLGIKGKHRSKWRGSHRPQRLQGGYVPE